MSFDWTSAENAIRTWFKNGSGLGDTAVVWSHQNMPQPAMPYATLRIDGPRAIAPVDEQYNVTDLSNIGQEVSQNVKGIREITVSCQVYSNNTNGSGTARSYLLSAQTALALPSIRDALNNAGLSVIEADAINDLSALLEGATKMQSRAAMDVRMYLVDVATEKTGYIETFEVNPSYS